MTLWCVFDLTQREDELSSLEKIAESPDIWDNPEKAQAIMRKISRLRDEINGWNQLKNRIDDALELASLEDESMRGDIENELAQIEPEVQRRELETLLSTEYDDHDAFLSIHAGAGGTDSQDWAEMLNRMYLRWAESKGFESEILDINTGEEAGLKRVTLSIVGDNATGYLRSERGVHRLVRLSPFDSSHRRHTSFALVEVYPQVESDEEIDINPNDLKIDTYRSAGALSTKNNQKARNILFY